MGVVRKLAIIGLSILVLFLLAIHQFIYFLLGAATLVGLILGGRRRAGAARTADMMTLGRFIRLLGLVALLAIIFSPSVLRIPLGGGPGFIPSAIGSSPTGMSNFLASIRESGYNLRVANNTEQIATREKAALFLIGADKSLSSSEIDSIKQLYQNGTLSLFIAEGNVTNNNLLKGLFNASVTGHAIYDPDSPFKYNQTSKQNGLAFIVTAHLDSMLVSGIVDEASPIILGSSALTAVANSSATSYEQVTANEFVIGNTTSVSHANVTSTGPGQIVLNLTITGPKTVIASGRSDKGAPALVISDSAPFANYLFNVTRAGVDEKSFVMSLVDWVTGSDHNATIIFDNAHYRSFFSGVPSIGLGIGPLFAFFLEEYLSFTGQAYAGFFTSLSPLVRLAVAVLLASGVYATLTRRYASEKRGKDDEPLPVLEQSIVAESQHRLDFMKTARRKGFYVATLARLYEVLDTIVLQQFGASITSLDAETLSQRLGSEGALVASSLFRELSKINDYANGKRRFLFPPVIRWKATVSKLASRAEDVLGELGLTISGTGESKARLEYRLRSR